MVTLIIFIFIFSAIGYFWSIGISYNKSRFSKFGYSFFLGQIFFLTISYFDIVSKNYFHIINVIVLLLLIINYYLRNRDLKLYINFNINLKETFAIVFIAGLYGFYIYKTKTLDTINHYFMASQIKLGQITPTTYAFPDIPIKYHYGWDLLIGNYSKLTGLGFEKISLILTFLFLVSSLFVLMGFLKKEGYNINARMLAVFLFFVGGGFMLTISKFYGDRQFSGGLSVLNQIGQSSWTFGIFIFLMLLDFLKNLKFNLRYLINFLLLSPVLITIGLTTASGFVLLLMTFIIILLNFIANTKSIKLNYKPLILIVLCFLVFIILNSFIGGVLVNGNLYDNPKFIIAPLNIPFDIYIKRIIAYLFLYSPLTTIISTISILVVFKNFKSVFRLPLMDQFLYACVIGLYLFPVFLWVENSAYWDNFCKFNYFGILASWILLFKYIESFAKKLNLHGLNFKLIYFLIVLFLGNEFFFKVFRLINFIPDNKSINIVEKQNSLLLKAVENNIALHNNIYLLNNNIKGMYEVDPLTNKSKVNLYHFINNNFTQFKDLSMQKGLSIANFYDFNFLINRDLELKLWKTLNGLYSGESDALNYIKNDFLVSSISKLPVYVIDWEFQNKIEMIEKSDYEDWIIFKVK